MLSDIRDDIKAIDVGRKAIRNFGITFFIVLCIIGGVLVYKGHWASFVLFGLAVIFLVLGRWAPFSLKGPYLAWMSLAAVLGFFMSRLILCLVFYLVVTPIGLIMRLFGKDLLNERWDKKITSYWIKKEDKPFDKKRYEKMF